MPATIVPILLQDGHGQAEMFEYLGEGGERVTVRSTRTIERLLQQGRITGETRVRREGETEFRSAAAHQELRGLAAGLGVDFGDVPHSNARQDSDGSIVAPASLVSEEVATTPHSLTAAVAAGSKVRRRARLSAHPPLASIPPVPTEAAAEADPPAVAAGWEVMSASERTPLALPSPATVSSNAHGRPDSLRLIGVAFLCHVGAMVAGMSGTSIAGGMLQRDGLAVLAALAGAIGTSVFAARWLARRPGMRDRHIAAASVLFGAGCLLLGKVALMALGIVVCGAMWTTLRRFRS